MKNFFENEIKKNAKISWLFQGLPEEFKQKCAISVILIALAKNNRISLSLSLYIYTDELHNLIKEECPFMVVPHINLVLLEDQRY